MKKLQEDRANYKLELAQLKEAYSRIITEQHHSSMGDMTEEQASSLTSLPQPGFKSSSKERFSEEEQSEITLTKIQEESRLLDDAIEDELYPEVQDIRLDEVTESERLFQNL